MLLHHETCSPTKANFIARIISEFASVTSEAEQRADIQDIVYCAFVVQLLRQLHINDWYERLQTIKNSPSAKRRYKLRAHLLS